MNVKMHLIIFIFLSFQTTPWVVYSCVVPILDVASHRNVLVVQFERPAFPEEMGKRTFLRRLADAILDRCIKHFPTPTYTYKRLVFVRLGSLLSFPSSFLS